MLFSGVVGQDDLKQKLKQSVQDGRIGHARLFLGQEGAGSLPLAIAYAQYLNCTDRTPEDSCGMCHSCIKYAKLSHPDLHFVFPVIKPGNGKAAVSDVFIREWREAVCAFPYLTYSQWMDTIEAENKQGGIFVDESEEILRKLSFKSYESEYKVMIIWMAEKMNRQTANKLLKILEEPPQKTVFLLIAESTDQILPTILSRTQVTKVPKMDVRSLSAYLQASRECDEQQSCSVSRMSDGNLARAVSIIQSSEEENIFLEMFIRLMRTCWAVWSKKQAMLDLMAWCDEATKPGRETQKRFLLYCLRMVRENFMLNEESSLVFLTGQEYEFSGKFSKFITSDNVSQLTEELDKAYIHIEANGNKNIVFLDMACKIVVLFKH